MYIVFDTETTGLPQRFDAPITDVDNWPRMVQLAWQLHDKLGELIEVKNFIVKPEGYTIPFNSEKIHGISTQRAREQGMPLGYVLGAFREALSQSSFLVGHNVDFDINIIGAEFVREGGASPLAAMGKIDTQIETTDFCALPGGRSGKFKYPKLTELHQILFGEGFGEAHNASADVEATARVFLEVLRRQILPLEKTGLNTEEWQAFQRQNPDPIQAIGLNVQPYQPLKEEETIAQPAEAGPAKPQSKKAKAVEQRFVQLHNHSSFSVLSATTGVDALVDKAVALGMPAVGLTDYGSMMGAFHFVQAVQQQNRASQERHGDQYSPIKAVVGCEVYLSEQYQKKKFTKQNPDRRYTQVLLAKDKRGYHNLAKLSSEGFIQGYYAGYPRVGKDLVTRYKEGLIALSGSISSEIPTLILNVGEEQAEKAFQWWHGLFGEDFYVELIRHGLEEEDHVNAVLCRLAKKYGVKVIAQNNTHYLNESDANAHDILLCVRDGEKQTTPIGRGRGFRFGFPNGEFYFKTQAQMCGLFEDLPEAIDNLQEITDKIQSYDLTREVLLPEFAIPEAFKEPLDAQDGGKRGENAYLRHLAFEGAQERYGALSPELEERLNFELQTIEKTGYPGYFLIVQDFTAQARKMGVCVGPGRGSAAGSVVAYCTGITNIDPIKYDLLFERFLNPDRVSLPDIDIDFDDRGRDKVIEWVVQKYGRNQVAQIITYGMMAAKSAVRDTGRVLDLPLPDTDRLAKLLPDIKLKELFTSDLRKLREKLNAEALPKVEQLRSISKLENLEAKTLNQARIIEGSLRNTGTHACGVIITPSDIREHVPVAVAKDADLLVTQFDNTVVERAGLLKMDFLALKTLTLIKDACDMIREQHGTTLDPDAFPLTDEKTYALFQQGDTVGIFQYESPGMQKHLRDLKPDKFDDLIAMNALYRPGPIKYIPNFVARKHGREEITYDLPVMEEYLKETYGITVYQEQVMLLSQKLAGFSKGEADVLRKAMGKKNAALLQKLKPKFLEGGAALGHDKRTLNKIWNDWEAFASYAFNKSHSTCYAYVAFQTAYLKAHYPAEYMASVLSNNMSDIKKVSFFMEECKRMGVKLLGPDINESQYDFTVNDQGAVRFGMGAVKGVGGNAVENIVAERKANGLFTSIFDLTRRIDLRAANKRTLENLALAGAFDGFGNHRAQYFQEVGSGTFLERAAKVGAQHQQRQNTSQMSIFGEGTAVQIPEPSVPDCAPWSTMEMLSREREVVGVYITRHPLDDFKHEIKCFTNGRLLDLDQTDALNESERMVAGIVTRVDNRVSSKNGKEFAIFVLEDYTDSHEFMLFGEDYLRLRHFLKLGSLLHLKISLRKKRFGQGLFIHIKSMKLLQDVMAEYAKSVTLYIAVEQLDDALLEQLKGVVRDFPGDRDMEIRILEPDIKLKLRTAKRKVRLETALLERLGQLDRIDYKLN